MVNIEEKGHGAIKREWDDRNIIYSDLIMGAPQFDWNVGFDLSNTIPFKVEDQDGSSSCVGQAWAKYAEALEFIETGVYKDLSAHFIYSRIYIPPDGGAYVWKGADCVKNVGVATEATNPSYEAGNAPSEAFMRIRDDSESTLREAEVFRAKSHAYVEGGIDAFALAIQRQNGLVTGFTGSNEGVSELGGGFIRPPKAGESTWGHAIYCVGAIMINGKKYIKFINSWSANWGDRGYGYIGADYFTSGYIFNGITLVDLPDNWNKKDMYELVRHPVKTDEVYALKNKVVRHIANYQTLTLGSQDPDKQWEFIAGQTVIRQADQNEWATFMEASEVHYDPKD